MTITVIVCEALHTLTYSHHYIIVEKYLLFIQTKTDNNI